MGMTDGVTAEVEEVWDMHDGGYIGGDGSDGVLTITSGSTTNLIAGKWYNYSAITIHLGGTLSPTTVTSGDPLLLRCTGNCVISGDINLGAYGFNKFEGYDQAPNDSSQTDASSLAFPGCPGGKASNGDGSSDGRGGNAGQAVKRGVGSLYLTKKKFGGRLPVVCGTGGGYGGLDDSGGLGGSGGGGSSYDNNGGVGTGGSTSGIYTTNADGVPGAGGGAIYMEILGDLNFASGANIITSGSKGSTSSDGGGPGGGGGGQGWIRVSGSITNNGTIVTSGCAGGSGTNYTGGTGGAGEVTIEAA